MHIRRSAAPPRRGRLAAGATALTAALLAAVTAVVPAHAATGERSAEPSAAQPARGHTEPLCGPPKPHEFTCFGLRRTDLPARQDCAAPQTSPGFGPADLRSAYGLPADGGAGATIAVVDAFDNPNAEADLAVYRTQYGLPPCTTDNGCFTKTDQRGGTDWSRARLGDRDLLDLDMVSAVAPGPGFCWSRRTAPRSRTWGRPSTRRSRSARSTSPTPTAPTTPSSPRTRRSRRRTSTTTTRASPSSPPPATTGTASPIRQPHRTSPRSAAPRSARTRRPHAAGRSRSGTTTAPAPARAAPCTAQVAFSGTPAARDAPSPTSRRSPTRTRCRRVRLLR
ncbi:hypothetical protein ACFQ3Z_00745 [Streptomyces nogalater]